MFKGPSEAAVPSVALGLLAFWADRRLASAFVVVSSVPCVCYAQVAEARKLLSDGEIERSLNSDRVVAEALRAAQQDGIVFIDEIDKIVETSRGVGGATSELAARDPQLLNGHAAMLDVLEMELQLNLHIVGYHGSAWLTAGF